MIKFRAFLLWYLILFIAIAILSGPAAAQDRLPIQQADPAALPLGGDMVVSLPTRDHLKAVDEWSMLAYQKLQNDNWDIYVHDNSGARRLTFAEGNNRYPSLDRGTKRIAFTSDRSGDMDLYTINTDGTGIQLIYDTASDVAFPAWSPDGRRLAIQVKIDDQFEIVVINADGSSPQRLTNHAAYDGMPTWSPDGKQLAFASDRPGDYRIYLMNADGSNIHRLSSFPFSLHPTWSPDGLSVAFDADIDGDGWQELSIIEASGANERMVYNPEIDVTAWAGSWSPDNQALGFTEITAVFQDEEWIWIKGIIRKWDYSSGAVGDLIPGGQEWYLDWQTKDATPPHTTLDPLPTFSRAENFMLRWSGVDDGGSGIKSYDVYTNPDDLGEWQSFLANTTDTQAPFPAEPGKTVQFLAQAIDNAFNQESWQQQNAEQTTFFNTMIGGMLTDNRGNPLSGVPMNSSPALLLPVITDWEGQYAGYTASNQDHILSITIPNFKPMPNTTAASGSDFLRDIYLLPEDTLILNGTFEDSGTTPTDWTTGGSLPAAISSKEIATGQYAVRLGQLTAANAPKDILAGNASISQKVTIPAGMEGPTLSFMGQAVAGQPSPNSGLRVLILPDTETVPVEINKPLSDQWGLNWIDMTPWLGQTVTVTFEMFQGAGDPEQTYYLDDISLGSINPDLWVTLASFPANALPGEPVAISLEYGNRGPAPAKSAVVELTLPPEITLVSATPPYDAFNDNVLRWNVGDLPGNSASKQLSIVVTPNSRVQKTVVVQAEILSDTPEPITQNNVAEVKIWITKNLFLPVLFAP